MGTGSESKQSKTLYDILNVQSDCSDKEIRNAYVQLSKQFHPDVQGVTDDPQKTSRFVQISEAYQTLSKPKLRQEYDQILQTSHSTRIYETGNSARTEYYRPWEINPDYDPKPGSYYGIKGLNKITNSKVAAALIFLGIAGGLFAFFSVKQSFTLHQKKLDEVSAKASEHHQRIRSEVQNISRDEQLRRLIERMANKTE